MWLSLLIAMAKLPRIDGATAIKLFEAEGYTVCRVKSSHHILKKEGVRFLLTVPVHGTKELKPGLLSGLLKDAGISADRAIEIINSL